MKTTALFALIVALLARGPAGRGSGQEAPGTTHPSEQPSAAAGPALPAKPEAPAARNPAAQVPAKESLPVRKD